MKEKTTRGGEISAGGKRLPVVPEKSDQRLSEMERLPHADAPWLPMHLNTLLVRIYSYRAHSESSTREIGIQTYQYMGYGHPELLQRTESGNRGVAQ